MTKPQATRINATIINNNEFSEKVKNEVEFNEEEPTTAKDLFSVFTPDSESDHDKEPSPKKCKETAKRYIQKYKKEWENKPEFKAWLSESIHGNAYFYCKFCKKDYRCGISDIQKHMLSKKHAQNTGPNSKHQKFMFRGLLCPVFTPFNNSRLISDIKFRAIPQYSNMLSENGVRAVLINDVIGEGMSLTTKERIAATEMWVENCKRNDQFLMVQIGGAPIRDVIDMAKHCESNEVGAIVLLPDLYNKPRNHLDLIKYLKIISEFSKKVPLLYHHNPKLTQVELDMTSFLIDIIGEIDSFVGIIYSTSDLSQISQAASVNKEKFVIFVGTDEAILGAVASGCDCIMATTMNFLPKVVDNIFNLTKIGKLSDAQTSQHFLNKTIDTINKHGDTIAVMKATMEIVTNICGSSTRAPQQTLWEGTRKKLEVTLRDLGIM